MTEKDKMVHIMRTGTFSNYPELAELLIKEGFGDLELCGKMLKVADSTAEYFKHRAEVAERALLNRCVDEENERREFCASASSPNGNWYSTVGPEDDIVICRYNEYIDLAKKELEDGKKNG